MSRETSVGKFGGDQKVHGISSEPSKVMHHAQSHNIELNVEIRGYVIHFWS